MAETPQNEDKPVDRVLIHSRSKDGRGLNVLRQRKGKLETGTVQPLQSGKPISGEVVRLIPSKESPLVCDVEVQLDTQHNTPQDSKQLASTTSPAPASTKGPARVSTARYRSNWSSIWGKGKRKASDLN